MKVAQVINYFTPAGWVKVGLGVAVIVLVGVLVVAVPSCTDSRNHRAATQTVAVVKKQAAKADKQTAKAEEKVVEYVDRVQYRTKYVKVRVRERAAAGAPPAELHGLFLDGVCASGLYVNDPQCSGRDGKGGEDNAFRRGLDTLRGGGPAK